MGSRIPVRSSRAGGADRRALASPQQRHHQYKVRTTQEPYKRRLHVVLESPMPSPPARIPSPPVPTLARKLRRGTHVSPEKTVSPVPAAAQRYHSPPVPAVAKKIKYGAIPGEDTAMLPAITSSPQTRRGTEAHRGTGEHRGTEAHSPPVPTLRKTKEGAHEKKVPTVNHTHLPPLVTSDRPGVILQQLSQLRKGLLSHRSTIDNKLASLFQ